MNTLDFNEFPGTDFEDWKRLVLKELSDKPYENILWENENDIVIAPFFNEINQISEISKPKKWEAFQSVGAENARDLNKQLLNSLMGGTTAIGVDYEINSFDELKIIFDEISIEFISTHFLQVNNTRNLIEWIIALCGERGLTPKFLRGSIKLDNAISGLDELLELSVLGQKHFSFFKLIEINAVGIHQNGGNAIDELAFAIATGNESLHHIIASGITTDEAADLFQFNFATSSSYFVEIAKYRAMRVLWKTIVNQYAPKKAKSLQCYIHAETSKWLQTHKDHNNNLLRATTQAMSAILGGANSVHIWPHDLLKNGQNENSLRLARNIQQLLIEECYFEELGDVAAGSFYIEELTSQLANKAWNVFLEIEKKGGISKNLDFFHERIRLASDKKKQDLMTGKRVVVGVNKYQNKGEVVDVKNESDTYTGFLEKE